MINKFKRWLYTRFLPAWCKEDLLEENRRLAAVAAERRQEIDRLNAYISGLETALRVQRHIVINTGEVRK